MTDRFRRPIACRLTCGNIADCSAADTLLDRLPETDIPHDDNGRDSNAVRRKIE